MKVPRAFGKCDRPFIIFGLDEHACRYRSSSSRSEIHAILSKVFGCGVDVVNEVQARSRTVTAFAAVLTTLITVAGLFRAVFLLNSRLDHISRLPQLNKNNLLFGLFSLRWRPHGLELSVGFPDGTRLARRYHCLQSAPQFPAPWMIGIAATLF